MEVGVWLQFAELMQEIRAQGLSKIIPEASLFKATETEGLHRRWGRFHRELPGRRHDGGYFVGSGGVWGLSPVRRRKSLNADRIHLRKHNAVSLSALGVFPSVSFLFPTSAAYEGVRYLSLDLCLNQL